MDSRIPPPAELVRASHADSSAYETLYRQSLDDPDSFWAEQARRIDWVQAPTMAGNWSFDPVDIRWFEDGILNLCHNCVDRHLEARADQVAILFEGDEPGTGRSLTYGELYREVVAMANCLKALGAGKGDRITLYMPMIPEAAVAMLACARIGAVHSVVFGGFSPEALHGRIEDCASRFVVTADGGGRGGRLVPLKANVDAALAKGADVAAVLVVRHLGNEIAWTQGRDHWLHDMAALVPDACPAEPMDAEDPLFILYTSGSTGKPKGVLHTTGGYAVWTATTFHYVFDYKEGELFWCTADVGWITGHSYVVYGPAPQRREQPRFRRRAQLPRLLAFLGCRRAPQGRHLLHRPDRDPGADAGRGGAGEAPRPLLHPPARHRRRADQPEAWRWYYEVVGEGRCPIVDTWWQTETGGIMITTLPGAHDMKPGRRDAPSSASSRSSWAGRGGALPAPPKAICASPAPGPARCGASTATTSASCRPISPLTEANTSPAMAAAAMPTAITGLRGGSTMSQHLGPPPRHGGDRKRSGRPPLRRRGRGGRLPARHQGPGHLLLRHPDGGRGGEPGAGKEIRQHVRTEISPIASPDLIHFTPGLPKTRSGKIMRRILRKIAENEFGSLGDTSTLADPGLVDALIEGRRTLNLNNSNIWNSS
jgi:acetyl-CoA synthetase